MEVSIREMKNRLSKYLKLVRTGKDVVITDRGKPVARLTLVEPTAKDEEAQAIKNGRGNDDFLEYACKKLQLAEPTERDQRTSVRDDNFSQTRRSPV